MLNALVKGDGIVPFGLYYNPAEDDALTGDIVNHLFFKVAHLYILDVNLLLFGQSSADEPTSYLTFYGGSPKTFAGNNAQRQMFLSNVFHLFRDWNFDSGNIDGNDWYNPVAHTSVRGGLGAGTVRSRELLGPETAPYPTSIIIDPYDGTPNGTIVTFGGILEDFPWEPPNYSTESGDINLILNSISNGGYDYYETSTKRWKFRNALSMITSTGYDFYWMRQVSFKVSSTLWRHQLYYIRWGLRITGVSPGSSGTFPLNNVIVPTGWIELNYRTYVTNTNANYELFGTYYADFLSKNWTGPIGSVSPNVGYRSVKIIPLAYHNPSAIQSLIGLDSSNRVISTSDYSYASFRAFMDSYAADIGALNFLSTRDAVETFNSQIEGNMLETLSEVSSLFGLLDLVKLMSSMKTLMRGRNVGSTLLNILDWLADARLVYSFALVPTVGDAKDVAKKSRELRKVLSYRDFLSKPRTVRGTYKTTYSFGEFEDCEITVRSKIRISVHPDSFLSHVIPIKSVGLLPTLSTIWDLVPYSFVIDWFTQAGEATSVMEDAVMMAFYKCHESLHSTNTVYGFSSDALIEHNITPLQVGPPRRPSGLEYRDYRRYVLGSLPFPVPTRVWSEGFQPDFPSWKTSGAFLFKMIR